MSTVVAALTGAPPNAGALWLRLLLGRPWLTLAAALAVAALSAAGSGLLTFRADERVFFAADNPQLARLDAFEARYGRDDNILVLVRARSGDLITSDGLAALAAIAEDLWSAPLIKRVDAPTNFQIAVGDREGLTIDQLWRSGDATDPAALERVRAWASDAPLLMDRLLSADFRSALVAATYRIPPDEASAAAGRLMADARERLERWREAYPELDIRLSGSIALDAAFGEASAADGRLLIPLMFAAILLLLAVLVASAAPVLAALLVIGGAIGSALGIGGLLGLPMTSVSVAAPFVITIVALCDTVHITFAAARARRAGAAPREAVARALRETSWPVFLTSVTTAVGFFSLVFSDAPPFAHLGVLCGLGAIFAWFYAMTITPTLLVALSWRPRAGLVAGAPLFGRIGAWAARRPWPAVACTLGPAALAAAFIGQNALDDRYIRYFDERFEFRRDTDALNRTLAGFYTLEFDLAAPAAGGVADPDYLAAVDRFATWLRAQPEVVHVASHADRIKMIHRALMDGDPEAHRIPEDLAANAQLLALYEMRLPHGLDLREQLSADRSASRLTAALRDVSTGETLDLATRAEAWIETSAPLLRQSAAATGTTLMFAHIGMRNIENMVAGTALAFLAIALLLFAVFRRVGTTVVAMIANLTPALAALGGWGLVVGELGMAVATIVAVTLGIVVDDTIHITTAIRRARAAGDGARAAARRALEEVGPGVAATTLCLAVGFFVLALSGFQINAWLGLMTAIVTLIAFAFDILFIPAALTLLISEESTDASRSAPPRRRFRLCARDRG